MEYGPLLLLAVPVLLLLLLSSRQRRQQREAATVQQSVAPGQEVMTAAGMYATVVAVDGDVITLESVPGQRSRWDRRAIVKTLPAPAEDTPEPDDAERDDAGPHVADPQDDPQPPLDRPDRPGPTAQTPPAGT